VWISKLAKKMENIKLLIICKIIWLALKNGWCRLGLLGMKTELRWGTLIKNGLVVGSCTLAVSSCASKPIAHSQVAPRVVSTKKPLSVTKVSFLPEVPDPPGVGLGIGPAVGLPSPSGETMRWSPKVVSVQTSREGALVTLDYKVDKKGQLCFVPKDKNSLCERRWWVTRDSSKVIHPEPEFHRWAEQKMWKPFPIDFNKEYYSNIDGLVVLSHLSLDKTQRTFISKLVAGQPSTKAMELKSKEASSLAFFDPKVVNTKSKTLVFSNTQGTPWYDKSRGAEENTYELTVSVFEKKSESSAIEISKNRLGIMTGTSQQAKTARGIRKQGKKALFEPAWDVLALRDPGTKQITDRVVLAWWEVIPPPYGSPISNSAWKMVRKKKWGSKHSCGNESRSYLAPGMQYRIHVMIVNEAGKKLSDRVVPIPDSKEPMGDIPQLQLRLTNKGFELNGIQFQNSGALAGGNYLPSNLAFQDATELEVEIPSPKLLKDAWFDEESNEGAILYKEADIKGKLGGKSLFIQRFSSLGEMIGPPINSGMNDRRMKERFYVRKIDKRWYVWGNHEGSYSLGMVLATEVTERYVNSITYQKSEFTPIAFLPVFTDTWVTLQDCSRLSDTQFLTRSSSSRKENLEIPPLLYMLNTDDSPRIVRGWNKQNISSSGSNVESNTGNLSAHSFHLDRTKEIVVTSVQESRLEVRKFEIGTKKWTNQVKYENQGICKSQIHHMWREDGVEVVLPKKRYLHFLNQNKRIELPLEHDTCSPAGIKLSDKIAIDDIFFDKTKVFLPESNELRTLSSEEQAIIKECPYRFPTGKRRMVLVCSGWQPPVGEASKKNPMHKPYGQSPSVSLRVLRYLYNI
jgi:hypothetical protein